MRPLELGHCNPASRASRGELQQGGIMDSPLSPVAASKGSAIETAAPGDLVSESVEKMHDKSIGALPVIDHDKVVGIFTERDALYRVIHGKLDPASTPVSAVMTKDPECLAPEVTVLDAMRTVNEKRFRHLPLVEDGKLIGLVSSGDLTRWVVEKQKAEIGDLNQSVKGLASKNKALIALIVAFAVLIGVGILTT